MPDERTDAGSPAPQVQPPLRVRQAAPGEVSKAAYLHASAIDGGFIASLGPRFLARLYERVSLSERSFLFVAHRDTEFVGFIAGTEATGELYREFLRHDAVRAAVVALVPAARSLRRIAETLRYTALGGELPEAELLALAVTPESRGCGAGRALVAAFQEECRRRHVRAARVTVGTGNGPAIALYASCGFVPAATVEVHAGTPSRVLVWAAGP